MAIRSSEISKTEYDVFLSFRGPDTRQGFTNVLYNQLKETGIQVFRDDDELAIGDTIELILEAIKNSKICVPIFSKSFASSAWCLREVAKMVELNKEIVPIFYDVTPEDVKLKTPLYTDQMKKYESQRVKEWEKALEEVGRIKGRALKEIGFVEFSQKFKREISLKLRVNQKYVIKHLVEMPDEVEKALKLLEIETVDVRFLGMYGMGGIGKTTLAKIIFNQISSNFDSCSFLTNIREERNSKGIEFLRTKLLHDFNPKASDMKMTISNNWDDVMERCVRMKSVLIVLDDVGKRSHIEELVGDSISFGLKSRVIITTRDERALMMNVTKASSSTEVRKNVCTCITKMEVKGMNSEQGMQLFTRHAFGRDSPPSDYKSLSKDVVSISGGLPLALEVIGSLLYGMSVEAWEEKVLTLKTIPAEDVQERLMISYNTLEDNVKEIFLDIACFFIHEDKSHPIYMWKACGYSPTWSVQVLIAMSLIKITKDGKFWMHDQLRDFGREIVRIKGNNNLISKEGSRIQTYEDALFVHERNKEKEVVGLRLPGSDDRLTNFDNFQCLRFLHVAEEATFNPGNFWRLSKNLNWLSLRLNNSKLSTASRMFLQSSRNGDSSYLMKLVVLDLSKSEITDNWDGWILIQEMRRLKVLNLTQCEKLTRTLNFSKMETLEKLILSGCKSLVKIDISIGKLRKLKYLNLHYCYKLKELPEEIGNLEDVKQIIMSNTFISKLPVSIDKWKNLEHLDLTGSVSLKTLPVSFGYVRTLVQLDIRHSVDLKKLPATIGLLDKLKHLNLVDCFSLDELPASIGDLASLVNLNVSGCYMIKELPSSITRLKKLERLSLHNCMKLVKLPDDLGNWESLIDLDLSGTLVVVVPKSIGDLTKLQVLNLNNTTVRFLPETIVQLSLLTSLKLSECDRIERIPELPISLMDLNFNVRSLKQAPGISKLSGLRELTLSDCGLQSLQQKTPFWSDLMRKLLSLEVLKLDLDHQVCVVADFSASTRLKSLHLNCPKWMRILPFPSSLESLTLKLGRETILPCLSNLNNLSTLELRDYWMEGGIYNLGVDRLQSLKRLGIHHCPTIIKFPDLSRLGCLVELNVYFCHQLVEIPGLSTVVSLKSLNIWDCDSLPWLENIQNLTSLRHVNIQRCKNFRRIHGYEKLSRCHVNISCPNCKVLKAAEKHH